MDDFTRKHLEAWLDQYTNEDHRLNVEAWIETALSADPEAIAHGRSWPELRDIGREMMTDAAWDAHAMEQI